MWQFVCSQFVLQQRSMQADDVRESILPNALRVPPGCDSSEVPGELDVQNPPNALILLLNHFKPP